ncbi:hypothetical protein [Acinetobacter sp. AGC35]
MRILILGAIFLANSFVYAQKINSYECVIEEISNSYECVIEEISNSYDVKNLENHYLGQTFNVNRSTGIISGALKNDYVNKPIIIDPGSKDNSFKVINYLKIGEGLGRGSNVYSLIVEEYQSKPIKSFTYMDKAMVFRGNCKNK